MFLLITDDEGKAHVEILGGCVVKNLHTLPEFLLSECHQRLLMTMGGVTLRDMTREEFGENIVGPVLRWAKQVRIIARTSAQPILSTILTRWIKIRSGAGISRR